MLTTAKQIEHLKKQGAHVIDEAGDDYIGKPIVAVEIPAVHEKPEHIKAAAKEPDVSSVLTELSSKLGGLTSAIKTAVTERPTIHVAPAKVVIENRPKTWVFTVAAHQPGEEYKVKAEAVEVL